MSFLREPEWLSEHAIALRHFLESANGQRFLERLHWMRPGYSPLYDSTSRLVQSGVAQGFDKAVETMLSFIVLQDGEAPVTLNFPDLDGPPELWVDVDAETNKKLEGE